GNIQLGEGGEVLKRFNEVEDTCLQALMSDTLHQFVPRYYGHISRNGENYIRLEDLLSGLKQPIIMDCKMGIRTYQEGEIVKARTKATIRTDMYQKMVKVDPTAPTEEENAQRGVTKLRYMQWRDNTSSTSTLGFRIEGIMTENGIVRRDFNKTRSKEQVTEALLLFTKRQAHILEAYLSRLGALKETLKESAFFKSHEVIGGSLLFVHDCLTNKANIWMIDFGKTTPVPDNMHLKHDVPWVEGNREDGYLLGLVSLISLFHVAIMEVRGQDIETHHSQTE
ncbi:inositol-trisphosphate 3-kinase B-like isoform X2, partial [Silurus meridionalis]